MLEKNHKLLFWQKFTNSDRREYVWKAKNTANPACSSCSFLYGPLDLKELFPIFRPFYTGKLHCLPEKLSSQLTFTYKGMSVFVQN